jgi:hypothetical protein
MRWFVFLLMIFSLNLFAGEGDEKNKKSSELIALTDSSTQSAICNIDNTQVFGAAALENIEALNKIVNASTKKEKLSKITIRHGTFGMNVGGGDFFAKTAEGKLVTLNIDVTVGLFGFTENIKESISLTKLMKGEQLKFKMDGGTKDILIIEPQSGFNAYGGTVKIKIWNGSKYSTETVTLKKVNGVFVAQKSGKKVVDIDIHMRGLSVSKMYVGDYDITTK